MQIKENWPKSSLFARNPLIIVSMFFNVWSRSNSRQLFGVKPFLNAGVGGQQVLEAISFVGPDLHGVSLSHQVSPLFSACFSNNSDAFVGA
jgi:hypothetical protein